MEMLLKPGSREGLSEVRVEEGESASYVKIWGKRTPQARLTASAKALDWNRTHSTMWRVEENDTMRSLDFILVAKKSEF